MENKIQYITIEERNTIVSENANLFLIEEQNIKEGNYLIFTDIKPIEQEISELKLAIDFLLMGGI